MITITTSCNYRMATLSMDCGGLHLKRIVLTLVRVTRRTPSVPTAGRPPPPPPRPLRRARRSPPSPPPQSPAARRPRVPQLAVCRGHPAHPSVLDILLPACLPMVTLATRPRSHTGLMTPSEHHQPLGFHLEENRKLFSSLTCKFCYYFER